MSLFFCEVLSLIIIHPACLPNLSLWLPLAVRRAVGFVNYCLVAYHDLYISHSASAAASLPDDITITSK